MKLKKMGCLLMTAAISASLLAGCGGSSTPKEETNGELVLWSSATGPDAEAIKATIDNYNATDPAFTVKFVSMEAETFNSKLTTAGKSGKGVPDMALIASESLPTYHSQGMLESWDDAISGTEVKAENYISGAWDAGSADGSQYGIPATMGSWIMYVNKDLAEKYVPGCLDDGFITYEEIEAAGEAAKADGNYACATTWNMQNFMNIYLQMGGQWLDGDGKISVNNEYSVAAIEEYKKMLDNGWLVPQGEDAGKLFVNGQIVFLPEGTWMLSTMNTITDFEWVETFTPQWDLNNIVQCAGADQFALFKGESPRSAGRMAGMVDFLTWLQGNQLEWCQSGAIPSGIAMSQNEEFLSLPQSFLITSETGRDKVKINTTDGTSYVFSEVDARMWDMLSGAADITETFDEIQKIVNEKMGY
ncbi:MAG: extracellular solute-binding protein [Pseudobutyrivibrio sp.]|nr:extracellular solute-binding protein [Pseudobutyrivibrio sp.]